MSYTITTNYNAITWNKSGVGTVSSIYDNGNLHIYTDDTLNLDVVYVEISNMPGEQGSGLPLFWDTVNKKLFYGTSSIKYKENLIPLPDDRYNIDTFMKMKPVLYTVKDIISKKQFIGFIAEDLDNLKLNEFVAYKNDEPESLYYDKITVFLTKIVQEQQRKIDIQAKQIEDLITITTQLKSDLEIIKNR